MAYTEVNLLRSSNNYHSIRTVGGIECVNDVYARHPTHLPDLFWYIGKMARCDGTVSMKRSVSRQWNLMEEHACRLRPVELGRAFGVLEIWLARGDSEVEMSQAVDGSDDQSMRLMKMERFVDGAEAVNSKEVGFLAEVVTNSGQGFFIVRDQDGRVKK